jgi:hypothetical protein
MGWKIKERSLARSATGTISKGAPLALLLCGLLGIASVLLVSSGTACAAALPETDNHMSKRLNVLRKLEQNRVSVGLAEGGFLLFSLVWPRRYDGSEMPSLSLAPCDVRRSYLAENGDDGTFDIHAGVAAERRGVHPIPRPEGG